MAERTINRRDGGLEDGQFFHLLMSPRKAKRPDERTTVEMYLDVLSKIIAYILSTIYPFEITVCN